MLYIFDLLEEHMKTAHEEHCCAILQDRDEDAAGSLSVGFD
jgi:hypothetical protein